jgi:hypothetical protein
VNTVIVGSQKGYTTMNSNEPLQEFIIALDSMMESSEKMFFERHYSNYRQYAKIKTEEYDPAREKLIQSLRDLLEFRGTGRPAA